MEIQLNLTLEEVNGIIAIMANLPFGQVHDIIQKIREQAITQVQEANAQAENQKPTGTGDQ